MNEAELKAELMLTDEEIAEKLHNTLGTKLKFESKLTDQDMIAFKDEMKIELHTIRDAQLDKLFQRDDIGWIDRVTWPKGCLVGHCFPLSEMKEVE